MVNSLGQITLLGQSTSCVRRVVLCAAAATLTACVDTSVEETIETSAPLQIVGSSTVTPFIATAAEYFGAAENVPTPVIETTGTGGGIRQFCSGGEMSSPSVVMASRHMSDEERAICIGNGVGNISRLKFGFDGIVVINSIESDVVSFSKKDLYLALSKNVPSEAASTENPHERWSDLNADLPNTKIDVYGPPPTSGTRDAFEDLIFVEAALSYQDMQDLAVSDPELFRQQTHDMRSDGVWTDAGENDTEIIRSVSRDDKSFGVVGFSYLHQSYDRVQAAAIDDVIPTVQSILDGSYQLSRPLFLYVNDDHRATKPELELFIAEVFSDRAMGEGGYLLSKGLVPLRDDERRAVFEDFATRKMYIAAIDQ